MSNRCRSLSHMTLEERMAHLMNRSRSSRHSGSELRLITARYRMMKKRLPSLHCTRNPLGMCTGGRTPGQLMVLQAGPAKVLIARAQDPGRLSRWCQEVARASKPPDGAWKLLLT